LDETPESAAEVVGASVPFQAAAREIVTLLVR
jgi:hypothetical protein